MKKVDEQVGYYLNEKVCLVGLGMQGLVYFLFCASISSLLSVNPLSSSIEANSFCCGKYIVLV